MITKKIKVLSSAKALVARLEKQIAANLHRELAKLPSEYGFDDANAFLNAVKEAAGGKRGRKAKVAVAAKKRRKRAKITPEIRALVKKLLKAGKTGAKIAKAVGISLPSVQNIKKSLGLVKGTKKKGAARPKLRRAKVKAKVAPTKAKKRVVAKKVAAPEVKATPAAAEVAPAPAPAG